MQFPSQISDHADKGSFDITMHILYGCVRHGIAADRLVL